jgi:DNA polymerase-3 subunit gamma/tau
MTFITKYRPDTWEGVLGQDAAVKALRTGIEKKRAQTFTISGPSGTGKTTLARIAATHLGCSGIDLMEVDAASNTGIDRMRQVMQDMQYKSVGGGANRAVIVDEAHGLSKSSWDAMLKNLEEPKAGVYWFLCTTNPTKIPETIRTRSLKVQLKTVSEALIEKLMLKVIDDENLPISDAALDIVIRDAGGSPRQALTYLAACAEAKTKAEAMDLIRGAVETVATLDLCRWLNKPGQWRDAMEIVSKMDGDSPEGVRIMVMNYFGKVIAGAKNDNDAYRVLGILEAFAAPYNTSEGMAPLMLSIGRALFAGGK